MGTSLSKSTQAGLLKFDILLIGLDNAGNSLFKRITHPETVSDLETEPTLAFEKETIQYETHNLTLWSIGGQTKIRPLWRSFLWNAHAYMFVVDATAPERFSEAKEELHRLHEELHRRQYKHPLLVVMNKMDSGVDAERLAQISQSLDVATLDKSGSIVGIKGVSAKTNEGVKEVMQWFLVNTSAADIALHDEHRKEFEGSRV
ncbi:ADP-ribosylation factor family-domain-containing protein [Mycena pura]|uniref:ADP-ribosylation factor family-domain-containing protein n=1 Tax=Mycena pura TaxID=153505 RepID=A0AAD6V3F5_9AGAR|nr:ADP-ribosylation factor family-domain-containing protein [Mycena pura]